LTSYEAASQPLEALRKMRHPARLRHLQGFLESEETIFQ
jgi:hypothetical protein